ncbi:uncharacterized protein LOC119515355 isoform X2 [Choloepus didactylus]|uniref:uncharacterized protein LOC119515355 isoform X2 n=1 Tax=Choloepus didactylus TaxID=27675 RepID=UPI00189E02AB|nr:uncharacterized protein LOC119515355 isoform X2 [Choloepus didactylus]
MEPKISRPLQPQRKGEVRKRGLEVEGDLEFNRSCEQELMRWPEIQETLSRHRNSPDLRMESLSRTVNLRAATEKCELKLGQRRWRKTEPQQHTEDNDFKCLKRLRVAELPSSYHTTAQKLPMAPYSLFKNFFIVITGTKYKTSHLYKVQVHSSEI